MRRSDFEVLALATPAAIFYTDMAGGCGGQSIATTY